MLAAVQRRAGTQDRQKDQKKTENDIKVGGGLQATLKAVMGSNAVTSQCIYKGQERTGLTKR